MASTTGAEKMKIKSKTKDKEKSKDAKSVSERDITDKSVDKNATKELKRAKIKQRKKEITAKKQVEEQTLSKGTMKADPKDAVEIGHSTDSKSQSRSGSLASRGSKDILLGSRNEDKTEASVVSTQPQLRSPALRRERIKSTSMPTSDVKAESSLSFFGKITSIFTRSTKQDSNSVRAGAAGRNIVPSQIGSKSSERKPEARPSSRMDSHSTMVPHESPSSSPAIAPVALGASLRSSRAALQQERSASSYAADFEGADVDVRDLPAQASASGIH